MAPAGNYKQEQHDASPHSADVRDTVPVIIEASCPSADRDRTLAPRPRVRCSIVSLVAGAGVAASEPTAGAALFMGHKAARRWRARLDSCREGAARPSSSFHGPSSRVCRLNLLFTMTQSSCSVSEPI